MTASPKSPPTSRAGFLKSILVGVSAASVVAARPTVESAEAAAEPLVETCEMLRERGETYLGTSVWCCIRLTDHVDDLLTCTRRFLAQTQHTRCICCCDAQQTAAYIEFSGEVSLLVCSYR